MRKVGKIGRINQKANKIIARMFFDNDIRYCEAKCSQHCSNDPGGLTHAHRHKRSWYRGQSEKLWDYKQVIMCCISCHMYLEERPLLTKEKFLELRGRE